MPSENREYFTYTCPSCNHVRNASDVVKELPREVLLVRTRPLIGALRRKRLAGPGRPIQSRCPGCSQEMSTDKLKDHRIPCVRAELEKLRRWPIQLSPKDPPDPHPTFYIHHVADSEVEFKKASNHDLVTIGLRNIAEIVVRKDEEMAYIRVLGKVKWHDDIKRWRFQPSAIGRPKSATSA